MIKIIMTLKKTSSCLLTVVVYPLTPSYGFPLYRIPSDDTISNTVHFRYPILIGYPLNLAK